MRWGAMGAEAVTATAGLIAPAQVAPPRPVAMTLPGARALAVTADGDTLYVARRGEHRIVVVDVPTLTVRTSYDTGALAPYSVAFSHGRLWFGHVRGQVHGVGSIREAEGVVVLTEHALVCGEDDRDLVVHPVAGREELLVTAGERARWHRDAGTGGPWPVVERGWAAGAPGTGAPGTAR